jgi:hypothetical protein
MSRSYRHTPIIGNACGSSDKPGKQKANRAFRAGSRRKLRTATDVEALVMPALREISSVWSFPKDGKHYMKDHRAAWARKYMRK